MNEIKDFDNIRIRLASPEQIKAWSYGEVKKPETINYRTLRPEKDGLFCERIFGTTKEWECYCGKFKSIRYKGMVCDRCGVEVTNTKVRRERMGHITLASPVSHIWYYRSVPSRMALLLGISRTDLQSVLYYEKYIVTDPKDVDALKLNQILTEEQYMEAVDQYGEEMFEAGMGAEAIRLLLSRLDLEQLSAELREEMREKGGAKDARLLKRIKVVEDFRDSGNRPEWMVLTVIPVIPPDLRPMVQLDGGRFATSDLNDLYRRVINRNNRLQRLISLHAPDIIIRNEKRMLQEAVDALFDNSKRKRVVKGASNRPLKSLSDMLKGKQGRFRQNLLGKRVDYSGRSVIVVGPELRIHQCGVPSKMALELYKPFIMRRLVQKDVATNIKRAKTLVEMETPEVWAELDAVVKEHPVMLNRAPTLHRLGIQAFEPVLVDGKALKLHPLVCHAFNADFDGDQMAIHVPLTQAAQLECWTLMLSATNLLDPANGKPIVYPSQDMVLGIYYMTKEMKEDPEKGFTVKGTGHYYNSLAEIEAAIDQKAVSYNALINFRFREGLVIVSEDGSREVADGKKWYATTPGRIIFNASLPEGVPFQNYVLGDKQLKKVIGETIRDSKASVAIKLLDSIKDVGYKYATIFGATIGLSDMIIPDTKKSLVDDANKDQSVILSQYRSGQITQDERYNRIVSLWRDTNEKLTDDLMSQLEKNQNGFNPLFLMAASGARGSRTQIRQLGAMRGNMAKSTGEIIELPIKSNFKEGLSIIEFFISTNGARKGLSDTALKTAEAGYLTRRLVDVSQDVVINIDDCHTINGIWRSAIKDGDEIVEHLADRIIGRCPVDDVIHPFRRNEDGSAIVLAKANELIDETIAKSIEDAGIERVFLRTVLTCEAEHGVCAKCYGRNLANNRPVDIGEAVGIIAAQSIGQPGTQLTMRTFHQGGTASAAAEANKLSFDHIVVIGSITGSTIVRESDGRRIFPRKGAIQMSSVLKEISGLYDKLLLEDGSLVAKGSEIYEKDGKVEISDLNGIFRVIDGRDFILAQPVVHKVGPGSELCVRENQVVESGNPIVEFDPFSEPILAEQSGTVLFADMKDDVTLITEVNGETGNVERKITEHRLENLQPRIVIRDDEGNDLETYAMPGGAYIQVSEGDKIGAGTILAKLSKASQKTNDITGGLPRVGELFEARRPKNPAVLAQVSGTVEVGELHKGKVAVTVTDSFGKEFKHQVPVTANLLVRTGDTVEAGEPICDGAKSPHDILNILGENALQAFLVDEVQQVYRTQGVDINDKHLGIIIRQMLRKVQIIDVGDTDFIHNQQVDKHAFMVENERVKAGGLKPAVAKPLLLSITRASIAMGSFISAASFQETTKALTDAAIAGSKDELRGLKENVIIGHLIPAGTGMKRYRNVELEDEKLLEELKNKVDEAKSSLKADEIDDNDFDAAELADMKTVGDQTEFEAAGFDDEENDE
ncbi:MAG: DNA-directed RNA polymerase subunit beta' [Sphaerochaetaceae bacterium]|nr:DNA-directed RNA polymerase subunit beta' [Sphaerochaetaceae bacterium]